MQETFVYLLSKFPGLVLTASVKTLLYPAVKNISIQKRKKTQRFEGDSQVLDRVAAQQANHSELAAVIASLPHQQAQTLLLRFVDGMSIREIAEVLDIAPGTVKSRLHHAIASLRQDEKVKSFFNQ